MVVNTLGVSYTDLQLECAYAAGWNPTTAPSNTKLAAQFQRVLKKSLDQFYHPPILPGERKRHEWSFLYPVGQILLHETFSTGTISFDIEVQSLVFTGAGTLPSTFTTFGWELFFVDIDGVQQRVSTEGAAFQGSDTYILSMPNVVSNFATLEYELRRYYYLLPDDFGALDSDGFMFVSNSNSEPCRMTRVSDKQMRQMQQWDSLSGVPYNYSLIPRVPTVTNSGHWAVGFGPNLSEVSRVVNYRYRAIPPLLNGSTHIYPYGGDQHGSTIIASLVDQVHQQIHGNSDRHEAFMERLAASVMADRQDNAPHNLGLSRSGYEDSYDELPDLLTDWHSQRPIAHTYPV